MVETTSDSPARALVFLPPEAFPSPLPLYRAISFTEKDTGKALLTIAKLLIDRGVPQQITIVQSRKRKENRLFKPKVAAKPRPEQNISLITFLLFCQTLYCCKVDNEAI